jgi:DNA polymerase III subunit chi
MARVDFYHLTCDPAPLVIARIAERAVAGGDGMTIVADTADLRGAIDDALWTTNAESFLPHRRIEHGPTAGTLEPILIVPAIPDDGDRSGLVALSDGQWRDAALDFARTLFLFDGQRIDDARGVWRALSNREGTECHYWRQDEQGRWRQGP